MIASAWLLKFWIFKVIGGGYLLYLAIKHFLHREEDHAAGGGGWGRTFWGTVAAVTFADIAFSIDSILAAVALADDFPARFGQNGRLFIVFTGGVLGIITMRFVVRYFVLMLDRFPGLAQGAYALVAWIGLKLVISGLHSAEVIPFHVPEPLFWSVMLAIAVLSIVIRPRHRPPGMSEGLELLEQEESADAEGPPNGDGNAHGDGPQNGSVAPDAASRAAIPAEIAPDPTGTTGI